MYISLQGTIIIIIKKIGSGLTVSDKENKWNYLVYTMHADIKTNIIFSVKGIIIIRLGLTSL